VSPHLIGVTADCRLPSVRVIDRFSARECQNVRLQGSIDAFRGSFWTAVLEVSKLGDRAIGDPSDVISEFSPTGSPWKFLTVAVGSPSAPGRQGMVGRFRTCELDFAVQRLQALDFDGSGGCGSSSSSGSASTASAWSASSRAEPLPCHRDPRRRQRDRQEDQRPRRPQFGLRDEPRPCHGLFLRRGSGSRCDPVSNPLAYDFGKILR